jgi:16S rRNA processing protein RimM
MTGAGEAPARVVVMGRVLAPYGVRGWVKIASFSEEQDTLLAFPRWWLRRSGAEWQAVEPIGGRVHGSAIVAGLRGVDSREQALALRGAEVGVAREALPAPAEDEVYWEDLIGLTVINRQGVELGQVTAVGTHGAHPVLTVRAHDRDARSVVAGEERLIPYVPAVVDAIDREAGRLEVDWGADY